MFKIVFKLGRPNILYINAEIKIQAGGMSRIKVIDGLTMISLFTGRKRNWRYLFKFLIFVTKLRASLLHKIETNVAEALAGYYIIH